jgi:hypothetical protein
MLRGSGIRKKFFRISDSGSRIPNPYFKEVSDNILWKKYYCILFLVNCQTNLLYLFKNEIISIFLLCCCCWIPDTGSWMDINQDPGSGINIPDLQHCRSGKRGKPLPVQQCWSTRIHIPFRTKKIIRVFAPIILTPSWLPLSVCQPHWRQVIMTGGGGGGSGNRLPFAYELQLRGKNPD